MIYRFLLFYVQQPPPNLPPNIPKHPPKLPPEPPKTALIVPWDNIQEKTCVFHSRVIQVNFISVGHHDAWADAQDDLIQLLIIDSTMRSTHELLMTALEISKTFRTSVPATKMNEQNATTRNQVTETSEQVTKTSEQGRTSKRTFKWVEQNRKHMSLRDARQHAGEKHSI